MRLDDYPKEVSHRYIVYDLGDVKLVFDKFNNTVGGYVPGSTQPVAANYKQIKAINRKMRDLGWHR